MSAFVARCGDWALVAGAVLRGTTLGIPQGGSLSGSSCGSRVGVLELERARADPRAEDVRGGVPMWRAYTLGHWLGFMSEMLG